MATIGQKQALPSDQDTHAPTGEQLDKFVALLPGLFYGVNRVLEDSAPHTSAEATSPRVSRKVVVALWALGSATTTDTAGKYLTTPDLVRIFREWFVVSEENANSVVSKVKAKMLDNHQYIAIQGGRDHIHLTREGEAAFRQIVASAKAVIAATIGVLNTKERRSLLDFAQRMIDTAQKKPVRKELL